MNISAKFKTLVHELDQDSLEELKRSVTTEIDVRRGHSAITLESIHPRMTAAEKHQAAQQIARLLKGQD